MMLPPTPAQTIGPFFHIRYEVPGTEQLVPPQQAGALCIQGRVTDGAGQPVSDALLEAWDTQGGRFGRCCTDGDGRYRFVIVKPTPAGAAEAPRLDVSLFARGLLDGLRTRIYFPDEEAANARDPVLSLIQDPRVRASLIARPEGNGLRFDIHLQGDEETAFFDY
jgi:protocatechuate 3,4-dioxygenase alpha subunit